MESRIGRAIVLGAALALGAGVWSAVLLVVPGGYVVRQEILLEQAIRHATYVSQQVGYPIAVTIPNPAGGPPRVEYVGSHSGQ